MSLFLCAGTYLVLFILFRTVWVRSNRARWVITPFFLCGLFEIVSVWPATIEAQLSGASITGAYPAFVASLAFAAMLVGFVLTMARARYDREQPGAFRARPPYRTYSDGAYMSAIVLTALFLAGLATYLYQGLPPLVQGLLALPHGGVDSATNIVAAGREAATKGHYLGGAYRGQGLILELMQLGWPYLVGVAMLLFGLTRKTRWLITSVTLFGLMLFFIAGSGQRWQPLEAMIQIGVLLSLVARPRPRWVVGGALVGLLLYGGMSRLNSNFEGIENAANPTGSFVELAASRIAFANGMHNVDIFNFVADGSLQLGLGTIHAQKFLQSIPGVDKSTPPFEAKLSLLLDPTRPESDSSWASGTYFGTAYADFGLPGTILIYGLMGIGLAAAQVWLFAAPKEVLLVPALATIILNLGEAPLEFPATIVASLVTLGALYLGMRASAALAASWFPVPATLPGAKPGSLGDMPGFGANNRRLSALSGTWG